MHNRYEMNDEKTALAREFLKASRDDFSASKVLIEQGISALAVFHFQQAVEKATKAQCLLSGIVTVEEIRRIRHESLRGQQIIASRFSRLVKKLAQANPKLDVVPRLDELMGRKRRLELARLDGPGIDSLLSACDIQVESSQLTKLLAPDRLEALLTRMKNERPDLDITDEVAQMVLSRFDRLTPVLVSGSEAFLFLFVASAITFPHSVSTRYPTGDMNPSDYNDSLGIVNRLPELVRRLEKVIEFLDAQINQS